MEKPFQLTAFIGQAVAKPRRAAEKQGFQPGILERVVEPFPGELERIPAVGTFFQSRAVFLEAADDKQVAWLAAVDRRTDLDTDLSRHDIQQLVRIMKMPIEPKRKFRISAEKAIGVHIRHVL